MRSCYVKKPILAAALVVSLALVGCNNDDAATEAPADVPAAVESLAAEAVESVAAEVDAVESMAADAQDAAASIAADAQDAVEDAVESATP